jgi:hypothetical protein
MESGEAALTQGSRPIGMRCGSTVSAAEGGWMDGWSDRQSGGGEVRGHARAERQQVWLGMQSHEAVS